MTIVLPIAHPIRLQLAQATLARATSFLGRGLSADAMLPIVGPHRCKVIGNSLRELDRFLNLLIDAMADLILPDDQSAGFERQRNTPNKVKAIRAAMGLPCPDHARLRAIGRSRDSLFHTRGVVRRGDRRGEMMMTVGWMRPDAARPARISLGELLVIDAEDIAELCRFYDGIVGELLDAFAVFRGAD